jgi:hypothetical protein
VTFDFDERKITFSFSDERGSFQKDFEEIQKITFRYYLTFVMDDARIMIKRPDNKKQVYRLLANVSTVDSSIFGMR